MAKNQAFLPLVTENLICNINTISQMYVIDLTVEFVLFFTGVYFDVLHTKTKRNRYRSEIVSEISAFKIVKFDSKNTLT